MDLPDTLEVQVRVRHPDGSYSEHWVPFLQAALLTPIRAPGPPEKIATLLASWIQGDAEEQRETGELLQALEDYRV